MLSLALYDGVAPDVGGGVAAVAAVVIGCAGSRFFCRSTKMLLHAVAVCDGVAAVMEGCGASDAE